MLVRFKSNAAPRQAVDDFPPFVRNTDSCAAPFLSSIQGIRIEGKRWSFELRRMA
jgi:hypothetical protein